VAILLFLAENDAIKISESIEKNKLSLCQIVANLPQVLNLREVLGGFIILFARK
jgi:hypothetical protein